MGKPTRPGAPGAGLATLKITGVVVAGGPLTPGTIAAVNDAATKVPAKFRHYIAYADKVKVGGSLAWRANNPGNLRGAPTKLGLVPGGSGHFAVFASLDEGRAAQRSLYLNTYGDQKVRDAIEVLTPRSDHNNTDKYLRDLQTSGVNLDKDVKSQIEVLMPAVKKNEGLIPGIEVGRTP